jgi:rubredoxin
MGLLDRDYMRTSHDYHCSCPICAESRKEEKEWGKLLGKGNKILHCYEHRCRYLVFDQSPETWECPLCREGLPTRKEKMQNLQRLLNRWPVCDTPQQNAPATTSLPQGVAPQMNQVPVGDKTRNLKMMLKTIKEMAAIDRGEEFHDTLLTISQKIKAAIRSHDRYVYFTDSELSVWNELTETHNQRPP